MFHPSNRRTFLGQGLTGLGSIALSRLLGAESAVGLAPKLPPKVKRVIFLNMAGALRIWRLSISNRNS
jgi:hypothetical protein